MRGVYPVGMDASAFGTPNVDTALKYVTCNGIDPPNAFGIPHVENINRYLTAEGISFSSVGTPIVELKNRSVSPTGFSAALYGNQVVVNRNPVAAPVGFDASAFGSAWVSTRTQYVLSKGVDQSLYGTQWVSNKHRTLITQGRDVSICPNPFVSHKNRTLALSGFDAKAFGSQFVSHQHRTYGITGFDASAFGATRISHSIQEIGQTGFDAAKYGTTRVEYRNRVVLQNSSYSDFGSVSTFAAVGLFSRVIAPSGIAPTGQVMWPNLGVFIRPVGSDLSLFGTPSLLPEVQAVATTGFAGTLFGSPVVNQGPGVSVIRPGGIASLKFGIPVVESLGQWVFCTGRGMSVFGSPRAANGVSPASFASSGFGVPRAAPSSQSIYPSGFCSHVGLPGVSMRVREISPTGIVGELFGSPSAKFSANDYGYFVASNPLRGEVFSSNNECFVFTDRP